ncbi:putative acetyl-CoA C-acetyltransferase YhfS [Lachnospiraceae bacterium]|nr:putative acetyl-CoA C-acetyltransferase YhfS [Lachnospiraceae bacterium]
MLTNVKLGKNMRSVSIVGVGATPFFNGIENPAYKGLTNGELFGYAALDAMADAGVEPRDVQYFFHGSANPHVLNGCITPNLQVADWFGMRGKGSISHSEGCCTGYIGLEEAVFAVASGAYDIVLSGCSEQGTGMPDGNTPDHMRTALTSEVLFPDLDSIFDRAYGRYLGGGPGMNHDDWINYYAHENGLTAEQVDDVLNHQAYHFRRNATLCPRAIRRTPYDEMAKEAGFDDVWEFMKSPHNPRMSQYLRTSSDSCVADGAAACIVVPTEIAHKFNAKPIEVLGTGASVLDAIVPHLEKKATEEAARQVFEMTGLTPDDMDLVFVNDFIGSSAFLAAEEIGYLPKGEGWKYALDGRLAYDGDKPMNTNGGRTSYGHAFGASGMADIFEAVTQMRGEAGERQVKKMPKHTFLRGFGGAQNVRATILKAGF